MSGGHFNYKDMSLKDEIFGYGDKCSNVFEDREISELVFDTLDLIHDFDWYVCGDTGEDTWLKTKHAFKAKWLGDPNVRVRRTIDVAIKELREELYMTYGIKEIEE